MTNFLLNKADFSQNIESDQYVIVKKGIFVGKEYTCDGMFNLNIKMNKISTFVYMLSSTNFWHARLCHINFCYVWIMRIVRLIPIVKKNFEKCESCNKAKITKNNHFQV